jgi:hypothetical protein
MLVNVLSIFSFLLVFFGEESMAASPTPTTQTTIAANSGGINNPFGSPVTTRSMRAKDSQGNYVRISLQENGARGAKYDPLTPFKTERYETLLIYEYFPTPQISLGVIPTFMRTNNSYKLVPDTETVKGVGLIPFASYLFAPQWLGTVQGGYYYDNHDWTYQQFAGGGAHVRLRQQGQRFFGALYLTWIGPQQPFSGSVRAGANYVFEQVKTAVDSTAALVPGYNYERGSVSLSGRLKYVPAVGWEMFFQTQIDYSPKVTRRSTDYRPGGGRQRIRFLSGPGLSYNLNNNYELSVACFNVQGFGFYRENQMNLRFRVLL